MQRCEETVVAVAVRAGGVDGELPSERVTGDTRGETVGIGGFEGSVDRKAEGRCVGVEVNTTGTARPSCAVLARIGESTVGTLDD